MERSKMSSITKVADIIDAFKNKELNVIAHACNCFNTMGSGMAKDIKKHFPRAYDSDQLTVKGDPKKLGQFTFAIFDNTQVVVNLYSQYKYGRIGKFTDEDALLKALENMRDWLQKMGLEKSVIGFPDGMCCGTGGGNWEKVKSIIEYAFHGTEFQIIFCKLP
jgi:O-acetyl-ADP-ribose deacetylase (regulator of RNase III)